MRFAIKALQTLVVVIAGVSCSQTSHLITRDISATRLQVDASGYAYDPRDTSCDGYPRLSVETAPGTCLGLVLHSKNSLDKKGALQLKMPRTIVAVPNSPHFLLADMGGWNPGQGSLFWLRHDGAGAYSVVRLLSRLDLPHGLALNPKDGFFYLGENSRITKFRFSANGVASESMVVVDKLPDLDRHMHPLTQFVFNPVNGDLYINSGAPTDHCYQKDGSYKKRCPEEAINRMATIQRIPGAKLAQVTPNRALTSKDLEVVAQGLRNSMAMAVSLNGRFLLQGENSRDFPELEEPYEELNVVRLDRRELIQHFGWPYCYNFHGESPEWQEILIQDQKPYRIRPKSRAQEMWGTNQFNCGRVPVAGTRSYQRPYALIPPHAAPLHAAFYSGEMFEAELQGHLLMSWHGYRPAGQRFVAYPTNDDGLPVLRKEQTEHYGFNQPNGCTQKTPFKPRGGTQNTFAPYTELISGWGAERNLRPKGAPVGFAVASDGAIWIVEDKNKTVVRLAKGPTYTNPQSCADNPTVEKDFNVELLAWRNALTESSPQAQRSLARYREIRQELRQENRCVKCHSGLISKDLSDTPDDLSTLDFFVRSAWIRPGQPEQSPLYDVVTANRLAPRMPPAGYALLSEDAKGQALIRTIGDWISELPRDIDERWGQITTDRKRNIRRGPALSAEVCGQFQADDRIYIDPRATARVQADGYQWLKVYLVPGHTRLVPGICQSPPDGVFYLAQ